MHPHPHVANSRTALTLAALGIVYGDIGTSPLYAAKQTFHPDHGIALTPHNVLGGVSAIFWALMIVVSLKYVILIMRANNKGEGGIMALLTLASSAVKDRPHWHAPIMLLGAFGAALFYGDAVLTPAISVLSAVEGLEVGTADFKPYVLPIAVGVVIGLFTLQRTGTSVVGALFGPVAVLWFVAIAVLGLHGIAMHPQILRALDPLYALDFLTQHGMASFVVLGAVLLAFTGAEALYADMGHFGKAPIRMAWFSLVFPALTLNYFGQGALLIAQPDALDNPFYLLAPEWALYPLVALATAATVIASQATISGTYSLTKQAIQLDYLPRMDVRQTSARERGQIISLARTGCCCSSSSPRSSASAARPGSRPPTASPSAERCWHDDPHVLRDPLRLGLQPRAVHRGDRLFHFHRCGILCVKPAEGARRRLVPACARRDRVHRDDDLAPRPGDRVREQDEKRRAAGDISRIAGQRPAASRPGHGHLHGGPCGLRLASAAAELRLQQGFARACHLSHHCHSQRAMGAGERTHRNRAAR